MQTNVIHRNARLGTIKLLSSLFPDRFGQIGARRFVEPRAGVRAPAWPHAFDGFERRTLEVDGEKIPLWLRGEGPRVLLVHGWEADHYAMGGFVEPLLAQGYSIAALDLPAHGLASGRRAPLPLIARAIAAAGSEAGSLHSIIAHSVGGATTVLAMEEYGLQASCLVLIGAPQGARYQALAQGRAQGLSERALQSMARQIHQALGAPLERFRTDHGLSRLTTAVMLVHAEDDAVVPIDAAYNNAFACQAKTLWLKRGGHNRPLGDAQVIDDIGRFLRAPNRTSRIPATLRDHPELSAPAGRMQEPYSETNEGGVPC
ncbi:MAG TPA: alpha/beta hydrolase [Pseudomonas xinjiangensis]|uniref:Alpha/beta hydrolase n=2 Tax=root TaxID=1 RepID=A0A7V1FSF1_9GAMM|nr:alpha/beta hydrolase [Halopseudomonas xinjiangensis]HEC47288.1 alpha/beta hydrolase [Halopseudomonas xinjiangensis]